MVLLLLVALLVAAPASQAASDPRPCQAALPSGPSVPAPIVFRNSCGQFRLDRDGQVTRLPRRWIGLRSGTTGRRYGADLRIARTRSGRIILRRAGRVVWRSSDLYYRDGGSLAFGPGSFAFASWRRGIFLTDLKGPERLIAPGVGLHPLAFLRNGSLLVVKGGWGPSVSVVSPDGSVLRRHRYRPRHGYVFDERTESLFLVTTRRMLVRAQGATAQIVRPLRGLDGWLSSSGPYLTFQAARTFAVVRRDGRLVSRWSWPRSRGASVDYGFVGTDDGRTFAFRTRTRGGRGTVVVYVLRAGEERATPVFRHRGQQLGCGVGVSFSWHDRSLLYSASDGPTTLVDLRDGSTLDLTPLAAKLPRRAPGERPIASWLSGFARP